MSRDQDMRFRSVGPTHNRRFSSAARAHARKRDVTAGNCRWDSRTSVWRHASHLIRLRRAGLPRGFRMTSFASSSPPVYQPRHAAHTAFLYLPKIGGGEGVKEDDGTAKGVQTQRRSVACLRSRHRRSRRWHDFTIMKSASWGDAAGEGRKGTPIVRLSLLHLPDDWLDQLQVEALWFHTLTTRSSFDPLERLLFI